MAKCDAKFYDHAAENRLDTLDAESFFLYNQKIRKPVQNQNLGLIYVMRIKQNGKTD